MIDTCGTACENIDDLHEKEESVREIFKPDFTVYTQGQQIVSMQVGKTDKQIQKSSIKTHEQLVAKPLKPMFMPFAVPTQLAHTIIGMPKDIQTDTKLFESKN